MNALSQQEQEVLSILDTEKDAAALSNALFSPTGLFNRMSGSEEERQRILQSDLYQRAWKRYGDLRKADLDTFEQWAKTRVPTATETSSDPIIPGQRMAMLPKQPTQIGQQILPSKQDDALVNRTQRKSRRSFYLSVGIASVLVLALLLSWTIWHRWYLDPSDQYWNAQVAASAEYGLVLGDPSQQRPFGLRITSSESGYATIIMVKPKSRPLVYPAFPIEKQKNIYIPLYRPSSETTLLLIVTERLPPIDFQKGLLSGGLSPSEAVGAIDELRKSLLQSGCKNPIVQIVPIIAEKNP